MRTILYSLKPLTIAAFSMGNRHYKYPYTQRFQYGNRRSQEEFPIAFPIHALRIRAFGQVPGVLLPQRRFWLSDQKLPRHAQRSCQISSPPGLHSFLPLQLKISAEATKKPVEKWLTTNKLPTFQQALLLLR